MHNVANFFGHVDRIGQFIVGHSPKIHVNDRQIPSQKKAIKNIAYILSLPANSRALGTLAAANVRDHEACEFC